MKKIVIKVEEGSQLEIMNNMMLHYAQLMKQITEKADTLKATCRRSLQLVRTDIDWATIHDIKFNPGTVELITFEHPLEQMVGPMSEAERDKIEELREQVQGAGLSQEVKKQ